MSGQFSLTDALHGLLYVLTITVYIHLPGARSSETGKQRLEGNDTLNWGHMVA
jgi:hypothetical protein